MENEIWKDVPGYEGIYFASNLGNVRSCFTNGKNMIPTNIQGYDHYTFCKQGVRKLMKAHRAVISAFIPNTENKAQVNHKNGIKTDNRLENLEWNTSSENIKHSYRTGLRSKDGENNHMAKLTEEKVREIKSSSLTQQKLADIYGVSRTAIQAIKNGKNWKHI